MDKHKILLPISECDVHDFMRIVEGRRNNMHWSFTTDKGTEIEIVFVREEWCPECGELGEPVSIEEESSISIIQHHKGCINGEN